MSMHWINAKKQECNRKGMYDIRKFCYELYKTDWESRITTNQKLESLRSYYNTVLEDDDPYSF